VTAIGVSNGDTASRKESPNPHKRAPVPGRFMLRVLLSSELARYVAHALNLAFVGSAGSHHGKR
jgi:hypothetical protein